MAGVFGMAAAACLLFYIGLNGPRALPAEPGLDYLSAFEGFQEEDELGESLAEFAVELGELELAFEVSSFLDPEDEKLEDLLEDVDDLTDEGGVDWSDVDWS